MYIVGRHPDHTYAIEVLNDKGEWVRDMYDVPIDEYSITKLAKYYKLRGYTLKQVRIVKVI
ncbi:hypothetical protein [Enterococcus phage BUCT630]